MVIQQNEACQHPCKDSLKLVTFPDFTWLHSYTGRGA